MRVLRRHPLLRLLVINLSIGISIGVVGAIALIVLNAHNLRSLIAIDETPWVAVALLVFGFVVTFGSVAMGAAIMMLGANERKKGGGRGKRAAAQLDPAVAKLKA